MEQAGLEELLKLLQAGGVPVLGIVGYLLWKLNQQMLALKISVDTLIDTLIRFVPGVLPPNSNRKLGGN